MHQAQFKQEKECNKAQQVKIEPHQQNKSGYLRRFKGNLTISGSKRLSSLIFKRSRPLIAKPLKFYHNSLVFTLLYTLNVTSTLYNYHLYFPALVTKFPSQPQSFD